MVLAHAGGWDELLLVFLPMLAFVLMRRLGRGRIPAEQPARTNRKR